MDCDTSSSYDCSSSSYGGSSNSYGCSSNSYGCSSSSYGGSSNSYGCSSSSYDCSSNSYGCSSSSYGSSNNDCSSNYLTDDYCYTDYSTSYNQRKNKGKGYKSKSNYSRKSRQAVARPSDPTSQLSTNYRPTIREESVVYSGDLKPIIRKKSKWKRTIKFLFRLY